VDDGAGDDPARDLVEAPRLMTALALPAPSQLVCLGREGRRPWSDLLDDARRVRGALAGHDAVCNLAERRSEFAAVLLAAMAEGIPTILPSSRAEQAVAKALDGPAKPLVIEKLDRFAGGPAGEPIEGLTGEVHVFTSGSTGRPVRHLKNWTALAGGARLAASLFARAGLVPGKALIIGTTPHQHMYGLEATILAALAHGYCVSDDVAFYPADLDAAVERAGKAGFDEIALVTSPPHLRYLEERIRALPAIRCVVSATAPLHRELAAGLEEAGRRVFDIYGCTETGSLAWRRTATDDLWTPLAGFRLTCGAGGWVATAPHLDGPVPLPDDIAPAVDGRFRLLGRRGDMVRIAGKRQSLGALNAALSTLSSVADAVIVREASGGEDRLLVYVVPAPGGDTEAEALARLVREHMRRHVDPVFIPRRVTVVSELPRGATGKMAADDLAALADGEAPRIRRA
jgi:acyl-CoA synthetase (AMP-forming)/AMP-acid ligase II